MYIIKIETENAAFEGNLAQLETARILRRLANDVEGMGLCDYTLRDINGNKVGEAEDAEQS